MAGYRLVWLELAEDQYRALPGELKSLIDRRLSWLLDDPTAEPGAVHNRRSDQYSMPLGDHGFLFFAVVARPPTVIVLRLVWAQAPGVPISD